LTSGAVGSLVIAQQNIELVVKQQVFKIFQTPMILTFINNRENGRENDATVTRFFVH
jgi:hypothetical protein